MTKIKSRVDPKVIEAEEHLLIDCQILLQETIASKNLTRSALAEKAGMSKARLSQLMQAEANPTVKTMARLFHALDEELVISTKKKDSRVSGSNLTSERPSLGQKWKLTETLTETPSLVARDDEQFVAMLKEASKEAAASNDNQKPVVTMESDVMLVLEAAA
jgi:transcriptional regulator with XRE-family HTH domain